MELRPRRSSIKRIEYHPNYRGKETPQEEFERRKRELPAGVRKTLSSYMISPTERSPKLVMLRNLTSRMPMILDVIEMTMSFFICGKKIMNMKECKKGITPGCLLGAVMPHLIELIKQFWRKVAGALMPESVRTMITGMFSGSIGDGLESVQWKELVKYLMRSFEYVDSVVAFILPFPHLMLKACYNALKLVNEQKSESFYEAVKKCVKQINVMEAWTKAQRSSTWTNLGGFYSDYRSLLDVCVLLFGSFLFQDATMYLERYRETLQSTKESDKKTHKFIWAAFFVRIFCRNESNVCTSATVMLSLPGFWALFEHRKDRLMRLFKKMVEGEAPSEGDLCFHLEWKE